MATYGVDFYLLILLMVLEVVVFGLFVVLYFKKHQPAFQALIISDVLFICYTLATLSHIVYPQLQGITFFQGLFAAAGLVPIVIFLEIFENGVSFNPRSSASIMFLLVIGAIKGASKLLVDDFHGPLEVQVGEFFNFIAPILFILVGSFYSNTITRMKQRVRFENQKKKIRKVKTGIYLTFILPKFISGGIFTISILPAIIWKNFDINIILSQQNIFETVVITMQIIGLVVMSLPIIFSQSVFFMQSRKVEKLVVLNEDGIPVFEFHFEQKNANTNLKMLDESYRAISGIIKDKSTTGAGLKSMNYSDLQIMLEIRQNFAAILIVDKPTLYLNKALESFANDFQTIYPKNDEIDQIHVQKLKFTAEKMIQKNFGLEQEEFEQIKEIVRLGYDKIGIEYSKAKSLDDEEVRLLPDFMKRIPTGSRILDAGCGAGDRITRILAEKFKVVGVDISKNQIEAARNILPYCEFICQDMTTLTFPKEYFDGIVSYHAIPHIPREEHKALVENFYHMLKKGGYTLLCFGTNDVPGTTIDDYFGVKMYWSSFDTGTNIELMKTIGFHVVWVKLIFDDVTEEHNTFILAQKPNKDLLQEIKDMGKIEEQLKEKEVEKEESTATS
ncbi:MAG: class I SAM-dependent methyltransferase [Candidatus Thorarchaeota archaeon]